MEHCYEARLRVVTEAKLKGEGLEAADTEPARDNVIDVMALKNSLGRSARQHQSKEVR